MKRYPRITVVERLARHVVTESGCWEYPHTNAGGYGVISISNRSHYAHRLAWELKNGPIPAGTVIRHRCDNPPCVNPDHLEPGTQIDNIADMRDRGRARGASGQRSRNGRKTHCPHGHEYSPENTYLSPRGGRDCRTCRRQSDARRASRKAASK